MRKKANPADVVRLSADGMTGTDIGKALGITRARVSQILLETGRRRVPFQPTKEEAAEVLRMYESGKGIPTIARAMRHGNAWVDWVLKDASIPRRGVGPVPTSLRRPPGP